MRFLEDVVARLSAELGGAQGDAAGAAQLGGLLPGAPRPPWLTDENVLAPLLRSYDAHLAGVEARLGEGEARVGAVSAQLAEVRAENDRLTGDLEKAHVLLASREADEDAPGGGIRSSRADPAAAERLELLSQENELLSQQQTQLQEEIAFLHSQLEERTSGSVALAEDLAKALVDGEAARSEADAASARAIDCDSRLGGLQTRLAEAEEVARSAQHQASQLAGLEATGKQHLQDLSSQAEALQKENEILKQHNVGLQGDLMGARKEAMSFKQSSSSLQQERVLTNAELADVRHALEGAEARLKTLESREGHAFHKTNDAEETAAQAKAEAEALGLQVEALKRELDRQQKTFGDRLAAAAAEVEAEHRSRNQALTRALAVDLDEARDAETELAGLRAEIERGVRERRQAEAEVLALQHLVSSAEGEQVVRLARQLSEVEASRDAALQAEESRRLEGARVVRGLEREKALLRAEKETVSGRVEAALQELEAFRRGERLLREQAAAAKDQAAAAERGRAEVEAALRGQLETHRKQAAQDVAALVRRLEAVQRQSDHAQQEAESLQGSREALLERYRAEGREARRQLERQTHAAQEQVTDLLGRLQEAEQRAEQAARESARGEEGLAKAHEVERELRPALAVAERRLRECKGQLAEAVSRETDRLREKGAAEAELGRVRLERDKLRRQFDAASRASQRMEMQCKTLQSALVATKPSATLTAL